VGFLAGSQQVVTCTQVVGRAVGGAPGLSRMIQLDFPFVAPQQMIPAQVTIWMPGPDHPEDLAGLTLSQAPPDQAVKAPLALHEHLWGHTVRGCELSTRTDVDAWSSGIIRERDTQGRLRLEGDLGPGLIGAPLWDEALNGVNSLLLHPGPQALALPMRRILEVCPEIEQKPEAGEPAQTRLEWALPDGITMLEHSQQTTVLQTHLAALANRLGVAPHLFEILEVSFDRRRLTVQMPSEVAARLFDAYRTDEPLTWGLRGTGLRIVHHTPVELQAASYAKSAYLAGLSHDLRSPLNAIIGFSRVILKGIDGPVTELQQQDLTAINTGGQRLLEMINEVVDKAKLEAGRIELRREALNVYEILKAVVEANSAQAREANLGFSLESQDAPDAFDTLGDRNRLKQALNTLALNALLHTKEGGVTVRAERRPETLHIEFRDTGNSIPPDQLELVFDVYTQLETPRARKVGGAGLGLPICRWIVALHGGRLWAQSSGIDGQGASFHLELPIQPVEPSEP
jgi:signal transduction histidine kinase